MGVPLQDASYADHMSPVVFLVLVLNVLPQCCCRSQMLCGELTLHTRTAIVVAQQLTAARFEIQQQSGGQYLVTCEGAAVAAQRG